MENKTKWPWIDTASIVAFIIMVITVCYQNTKLDDQYQRIASQEAQIHELSDALSKSITAQNDMVEIQKEQTAAILALSEKVERLEKRRK